MWDTENVHPLKCWTDQIFLQEEEKKAPQKTKEQLEKEKQAALSTRITALNEDIEGTEALAEYAKELHNQIRNLVSNMYNLEDTYKRHQYDVGLFLL